MNELSFKTREMGSWLDDLPLARGGCADVLH